MLSPFVDFAACQGPAAIIALQIDMIVMQLYVAKVNDILYLFINSISCLANAASFTKTFLRTEYMFLQ